MTEQSVLASTSQSKKAKGRNEANPQKILEATLELMAEHGYAGTSISMICQKSGYPATSIYWHFGNKEKLLLAALEYSAVQSMGEIFHSVEFDEAQSEENIAQMNANFVSHPPLFIQMLFVIGLESSAHQPEIQDTIKRIRSHIRTILIQHLHGLAKQNGVEIASDMVESIADISMAIGDGLVMSSKLEPGRLNMNLACAMHIKAIKSLVKGFCN